jgi:hypothetical protein
MSVRLSLCLCVRLSVCVPLRFPPKPVSFQPFVHKRLIYVVWAYADIFVQDFFEHETRNVETSLWRAAKLYTKIELTWSLSEYLTARRRGLL